MDITQEIKGLALSRGADLVGVASCGDLPDNAESFSRLLPGARRVVVVASRHNLAALSSGINEVAQFDTIHTYDETARATHAVARRLADHGHAGVAVPAFIPLDMAAPKKGMRGEIDWRRAAVRAGLGSYGENGLLVTPKFGSAVRLSGVVTDADLTIDEPLAEDACDHCCTCVTDCPPGALTGGGVIDKKKCGDHIFRYGFRYFQSLMAGVLSGDPGARSIIEGQGLREVWQNFMTGNYYYCFRCQVHCHRSPPK